MTQTDEKTDSEIVCPEVKLWRDVKERTEEIIKESKNTIMVNEVILKACESELSRLEKV